MSIVVHYYHYCYIDVVVVAIILYYLLFININDQIFNQSQTG